MGLDKAYCPCEQEQAGIGSDNHIGVAFLGLLILITMIVVPIAEIAVFIQAGELIGLWPTIATVILTAIIGSALLRYQGLATLVRVQESMNAGRLPVEELFDGLCLLIAGAFLLTPGFVTDTVGLLLFLPPFRALLRTLLAKRIKARAEFSMHTQGRPGPGQNADFNATIIDGEFHEVQTKESDTPDADRPLPPPQN